MIEDDMRNDTLENAIQRARKRLLDGLVETVEMMPPYMLHALHTGDVTTALTLNPNLEDSSIVAASPSSDAR